MASQVTYLGASPSFPSVKEHTKGLDSTDSKMQALVIFGHLLEFASLASMVAVVPIAFAHGVVVLYALPFCVVVFSMGTALKEANLLPSEAYGPAHIANSGPRVAGQPVPLSNLRQNCWLNSAMQCILRIGVLQQRALDLGKPVLTAWIEEYEKRQASVDPVQPMSMEGLIPLFGRPGAEDPAVVFGTLLHTNPLYQLTQTTSIGSVASETLTRPEILIQLETPQPNHLTPKHEWDPGHLDVENLLNHFLSSETREGAHIHKQFSETPDTLAVRINRYYHTGRDQTYKIHMLQEPVQKINAFTMGTSQYVTEAFMIYENNHYYACVYKVGKWWKCDDTRIYEISKEQALQLMNKSCFFFANRQVNI